MGSDDDTSVEAQAKRNLKSDLRFVWGCQLAILVFGLIGLIPVGLAYVIGIPVATLNLLLGLFYGVVGIVAFAYRQRLREAALGRSICKWLGVISLSAALLFMLLAVSR